jgi:hypothetical protein
MARVLDRLPASRRERPSSGTTQHAAGQDRAGWGLATTDARLRAALDLFGHEPNTNAAGRARATGAVADVQRYAAAFGLDLNDEQARGVLARCGWLTYGAMDWIDRLVGAVSARRVNGAPRNPTRRASLSGSS